MRDRTGVPDVTQSEDGDIVGGVARGFRREILRPRDGRGRRVAATAAEDTLLDHRHVHVLLQERLLLLFLLLLLGAGGGGVPLRLAHPDPARSAFCSTGVPATSSVTSA